MKDLARGIILGGQKGQGEGYSLAVPTGYSILEIAEAFGGPIDMIDGYPGRWDVEEPDTRARDELEWSAT